MNYVDDCLQNRFLIWLAVFFLLFFLNKLLGVYQKERPYAELFDAAFLLGMSVLIYPPTIFLFPLIYVANLTYSAVGWRNYIIPVLGFISPLLMMACYLFFVDTLPLYKEHYLRMLNLFLPSIEKISSEHKSAELCVVQNSGHVVNIDQPNEFNNKSISFIRNLN